ncbi:hypothetical protein D9M68_719020 [compost metagenome]
MQRARHQLLAGARFPQQQHGGARGRHARHQCEHALEGLGATDQPLSRGLALRHPQRLHLLHIKRELTIRPGQGRELDVHVFLALRRVVQVQHTLALARGARLRQWAGLARLVAGHGEMVRDLVAATPDHAALRAVLAPVGRVGRQDAVARVEQDVRLGQAFEKGSEFWQGFQTVSRGDGGCCHCLPILAVSPASAGFRSWPETQKGLIQKHFLAPTRRGTLLGIPVANPVIPWTSETVSCCASWPSCW